MKSTPPPSPVQFVVKFFTWSAWLGICTTGSFNEPEFTRLKPPENFKRFLCLDIMEKHLICLIVNGLSLAYKVDWCNSKVMSSILYLILLYWNVTDYIIISLNVLGKNLFMIRISSFTNHLVCVTITLPVGVGTTKSIKKVKFCYTCYRYLQLHLLWIPRPHGFHSGENSR